jgi:hypothetical protein
VGYLERSTAQLGVVVVVVVVVAAAVVVPVSHVYSVPYDTWTDGGRAAGWPGRHATARGGLGGWPSSVVDQQLNKGTEASRPRPRHTMDGWFFFFFFFLVSSGL